MDTFGNVLSASMLKAGASVVFEQLETLLEDTLLGVIFENFTVNIIQEMGLEHFELAVDKLSLDEAFSELRDGRDGVDIRAVLGEDGGLTLWETYNELEIAGLLDTHPTWRDTYDDDYIYARDYLDLEESEHTNLKSEIDNIAETLIENYKRDILSVFFGTFDPQKVKGQFADFVNEALSQVEAFSEILEELSEYQFGILTDLDEIVESKTREYPLEVVRRMLRVAPEEFSLNTNSTCRSASGVRIYNDEFFKDEVIPEHLKPWAFFSDNPHYAAKWLEECKAVGARTVVDWPVYIRCVAECPESILDFDAVVYNSAPQQHHRVPDNCTLIIHTRTFINQMDLYDWDYFVSPEQGLYNGYPAFDSDDIALTDIEGHVDEVLLFVGQETHSSLTLPPSSNIPTLRLNSGFVDMTDYLDPTFGFGDTTTVYARMSNDTSVTLNGFDGRIARSLYVDEIVMELGGLRLDRKLLNVLDDKYPGITDFIVCLETLTDDVAIVATASDEFLLHVRRIVSRKGGNVIVSLRALPNDSISTHKDVSGFEDFTHYHTIIYTDCVESSSTLQHEKILRYFGWQSPKKLYKNSNFISYSYMYMFIFQILGRFGEHVQSDLASQTLPIGAMLEVYFEKNPPQNPKQFLDRARDLLLESRHPLIPPTSQYTSTPYMRNFFTNSYIATLSAEDLEPYGSPLRFLYSFIDTYTKPLAILYNAIQFGGNARPNPEIRKDKQLLTSSYPLNYSDGSWVNEYLQSIFESQGAEFTQRSLLRENTNPQIDQINEELNRFTQQAEVKEYFEIKALIDMLDLLREGSAKVNIEYPKAMRKRERGLLEIITPLVDESMLKSPSEFEHKVVYDLEGGFDMSPFSQQLVAAITFFSKFTSLAMGPFIVGVEGSRFYELFMRGDSSEKAPVKNSADFRDLFKFPVVTSGIRKILKNPKVMSVVGTERKRLPFTRANLPKNLVPLDLIRYFLLNRFSDTYSFVPMGMDRQTKIPSKERLSLGAYVSTFSALIHANKTFLDLQSADQYGAAQAVLSPYSVDFEDLRSVDGSLDLSDYANVVRQATADIDTYNEESKLSPASAEVIKDRFRNLSGAYSICIGQIAEYAKNAADMQLEVFTFFQSNTNVSTLGLSLKDTTDGVHRYDILDSNGQNNESCNSFGPEAAQFIVNWLADIVLKYTISEDDLTQIIAGTRKSLPKAKIEFSLNDSNVKDLFRMCAAYTESPVGFCTRLTPIFEKFNSVQIELAKSVLSEIDLFRLLLESEPKDVDEVSSLYSNVLSVYSEPLFRAVK